MITSHPVLFDRANDFKASWILLQLQSLDFLGDSLFANQYPAKVYEKRVSWQDQVVSLTHLELTVPGRCGLRYCYQGVKVSTKLSLVSDMQAFLFARMLDWKSPFSTVLWVSVHSPSEVRHALIRREHPLSLTNFEVYDAY